MTVDKRFLFACFGRYVIGGRDAGFVKVQNRWLKLVIKKSVLCTSLLDRGNQDERTCSVTWTQVIR